MTTFTISAPDGSDIPEPINVGKNVSLVQAVDKLLNTGVVVEGDVTLGVGNVDLIYLGVRLVLCSADRLLGEGSRTGLIAPRPSDLPAPDDPFAPPPPVDLPALSAFAPRPTPPPPADLPYEIAPPPPPAFDADEFAALSGAEAWSRAPMSSAPSEGRTFDSGVVPPLPSAPANASSGERGLAQLVLTLVELLRDLMERQAIRRMENGTLTPAEVERLGESLMMIAERMDELKALFDLSDDDLNIDLGPLGKLLD
jgi:hypothetical protein